MNGINFTICNGRVECAASDGHKLARNSYPLSEAAEDCSFLLSAKAAKIVKALMQKKEGFVEVVLDGRNIAFKTETDSFSSRLIEGKYPNYNAVIPSDSDKEATIDRQALLSAIRRVSVFAEKANRMVVMTFSGMSLLLAGARLRQLHFGGGNRVLQLSRRGHPYRLQLGEPYAAVGEHRCGRSALQNERTLPCSHYRTDIGRRAVCTLGSADADDVARITFCREFVQGVKALHQSINLNRIINKLKNRQLCRTGVHYQEILIMNHYLKNSIIKSSQSKMLSITLLT